MLPHPALLTTPWHWFTESRQQRRPLTTIFNKASTQVNEIFNSTEDFYPLGKSPFTEWAMIQYTSLDAVGRPASLDCIFKNVIQLLFFPPSNGTAGQKHLHYSDHYISFFFKWSMWSFFKNKTNLTLFRGGEHLKILPQARMVFIWKSAIRLWTLLVNQFSLTFKCLLFLCNGAKCDVHAIIGSPHLQMTWFLHHV